MNWRAGSTRVGDLKDIARVVMWAREQGGKWKEREKIVGSCFQWLLLGELSWYHSSLIKS